MREILFRGKRIDNGEFTYGNIMIPRFGGETCIVEQDAPFHSFVYEVAPSTIGQFTGLTDKNGKKIFEGDIVEPVLIEGTHQGFSWGRQVVVFDRGAFGLKSRREEITPMCNYAANVQFEVIGNIHDNPELLEAQ